VVRKFGGDRRASRVVLIDAVCTIAHMAVPQAVQLVYGFCLCVAILGDLHISEFFSFKMKCLFIVHRSFQVSLELFLDVALYDLTKYCCFGSLKC
jgi:hypothetical protein